MTPYEKLNRAAPSLTVSASAPDDETAYFPQIRDGRINRFDIAAPVAIYDFYGRPRADAANLIALDRIEFWDTDGHKVLEVSKQQIVNTLVNSAASVLVAADSGYNLFKEADGSLTLIVGTYQFNWIPSL